jgi:hypothetical protein
MAFISAPRRVAPDCQVADPSSPLQIEPARDRIAARWPELQRS